MTKWGSLGDGDAQFTDAAGIGADALGRIYIVDHSNDRIEKIDSNGNGQFNKILMLQWV